MALTTAQLNEVQMEYLPGNLGIEWTYSEHGIVRGCMTVTKGHLASTGYLHAAAVVALADSAAGYGCLSALPAGADGFTTVELKANFLGTARSNIVLCEARLVHAGRTTQVWDATVTVEETSKVIALFRCTQMILYPKASV